jgi:hypothetical protein
MYICMSICIHVCRHECKYVVYIYVCIVCIYVHIDCVYVSFSSVPYLSSRVASYHGAVIAVSKEPSRILVMFPVGFKAGFYFFVILTVTNVRVLP